MSDQATSTVQRSPRDRRRQLEALLRKKAQKSRSFPLSFAQQRLWLLEQLDPGNPVYNIPLAIRLTGALNIDALNRTLNDVVARHESLRTRIAVTNDEPMQLVDAARQQELTVVNLEHVDPSQRDAEAITRATEEARKPFRLEQGPLFRALLLRFSPIDHVLVVVMHHIISDDWSMGVLFREVALLYQAHAADRPSPLKRLTIQYADYAVWQRQRLQGETLERELDYWRRRLEGVTPLELPTDRSRLLLDQQVGATVESFLPHTLTQQLKDVGRREGATLYMTLLTAFQVLLYRYSGQEDIAVGSPIAGRLRSETEGLVGFFVNTLVMRANLAGDPSFRDLLQQVRQSSLEAFGHQEVPFERLVETLNPQRDISRHPLFQVMFTLQNAPWPDVTLPGVSLSVIPLDTGTSKFDLSFTAREERGGLSLLVEYNANLFRRDTIQRMLKHFENLLAAIVANPNQHVSELELMDEAERQTLLVDQSATRRDYPDDALLHHLVEAQARRTSDAVAVVFEDQQITYRQLDERANRLAQRLLALGVGPDTMVGIFCERSLEMVVGIFGVLKAGGAYVPLDPAYPIDRLEFMLADGPIPLLLTQRQLAESLSRYTGQVLVLGDEEDAECGIADLESSVTADHAAYVLYTSGSTGRPKGVVITHRAICNHMFWMADDLPLGPHDAVLQKTSASFDASVWEFFAPLMAGARLVMAQPYGHLDPGYLVRAIQQHQITILQLVPTLLQVLVAEPSFAQCTSLRRILVGGEALPAELVRRTTDLLGAEVCNLYGPTEATIDATFFKWDGRTDGTLAPIGRPIANVEAYVLSAQRTLMPMGLPGELYLGGAGLARGYLNRPELTAERFVPHPFRREPESRLYRTGDLVRWLPDGNLEFLGRLDHQVKIRGNRIELGEIQAALADHPEVVEAVVTTFDNDAGGKELAAYIVQKNVAPHADQLREFLQKSLPDYMIPTAFVPLEAIPLSASGKVDYKSLPRPTYQRASQSPYTPPRSPDEELLVEIWQDVLHVDQVGVHDNFFALGGHSLLATQVVSRIARQLNVDVPLRDMFQTPTIAELAQRVVALRSHGEQSRWDPIPMASRDGELLPSLTQEALWFLDQLERDQPTYTVYPALRMKGTLDTAVLERALNEIVRRHESLRTRFPEVDGRPVQVIDPPEPRPLALVDLSDLSDSQRDAAVQDWILKQTRQPIDLQNGPLIRVTLLRLAENEHVLVAAAHHIIYDGWSLGTMTRELAAIYSAYRMGRPSPLPELPIQYADFAIWQRQYLQGEALERLQSYWAKQLAGLPPLELPTDYPRPAIRTARGETLPCNLTPELSAGVKDFCRREGVTPFMTLLTALHALLARYSGQDDVAVGSPVANRMRPETEPLIGYFINMVVLRGDLSGNPSFREMIRRVRQVALDAYEHQELTLDRVVDVVKPVRDASRHPLFQVMFVLQNNEPASLREMGLEVEPVDHGLVRDSAYFEFSLSFEETSQGFRGALNFNTDLFRPDTIRRMARHYQTLLSEVIADPDRPLSAVPLVDEDERQTLLFAFNDARLEFQRERCVYDLFESRVQQSPDAVAIVDGARHWTYGELNRRANQLARYLQRQGVGPEVRVGICLERSPELVMAVLGVLKAGGAYVPLDPAYLQGAEERAKFVLQDAQAALVLTESTLSRAIDVGTAELLILDSDATDSIRSESGDDVDGGATAENLAYVLYTSGSTGRPKGVMVTHGNLLNAYYGWEKEYHLLSHVRAHLQMASFGFDVFAGDLVRALGSGAKLVICRREILLDPEELLCLMRREQVDGAEFVPVVLRTLVQHLEDTGQSLDFMRLVVVGSDAWYVADHQRARRVFGPATRLINSYGLTETTIDSSFFEGEVESTTSGLVPIGRPFPNVRLYVLDDGLQPTPIGVPGELYIGGEGVARGYVCADLNAARFMPDPFVAETGARMCRTGDRARWRPDGQVEFLGRADDQVKIRGFRIEPGEVEQVLREHPLLAEAAVVVRERGPGEAQLVAYTAAREGGSPTLAEMRHFLRQRLPEYMIPTMFVTLAALPLTSSGKVDRRALPAPDWSVAQREGEFVAPRTPVEQQLASIWSELLSVEPVGAHDNFFDLGGNSLLALRLASRVRNTFSIDLPLVTLFTAPILEELAERVVALQAAGRLPELPPIQPVARDAPVPLSYGQEALWVISRLQAGPSPYALFPAARVKGPLNVHALERALNELLRRHESLRTTFTEIEGRPVQVIAPFAPQPLTVVDLSERPAERREEEVRRYTWSQSQRPIDLSEGPLARVEVLMLAPDEHVVFIGLHHIIYDGWSIQVLSRELFTAYRAFAAGRPSPLAELPIQYADFAVWQRTRLQGEVLDGLRRYWLEQLQGLPTLELPTERIRPAVRTTHGAARACRLSGRLSHAIKGLSRQAGTTTFMTLLAAFQTLLGRYSGQDDFAVGTPVAGRLRPETESLIGFFVNTLMLRADLSGDPSFREVLARVRETALEAFDHQELPFERLVQELNPPRDPSRHPVFQVMLVLQNAPEPSQELAEFRLTGLEAGPHENAADFDLTLTVDESRRDIQLSLGYRTDLFDEPTIARMLEHFENLLEAIVADIDLPISRIPLSREAERRQLLVEWNDTARDYGSTDCLHQLIEAQAARSPDAVAVDFEGRQLTYRELNERANQLAHYLARHAVGPDVPVGVCLERSVEMVVGLLAILKAGGAYMPLDPDYPAERLAMMVRDSRPPAVLATRSLAERLPAGETSLIILDEAEPELAGESRENLPSRNGLDDVAYVIYTSGSTGTPKGVRNTHRGICNRLLWMQDAYQLTPVDRVLQKTPFSFDVSVWEFFWPLLVGARLVVARPGGHKDPRYLVELIVNQQITTLHFVPSMLRMFLLEGDVGRCRSLKRVICSGEALPYEVQQQFFAHLDAELHNLYGPTEAAVDVTFWKCRENQQRLVPIGKPIANIECYILDAHRNPQPMGVSGELYLGGIGLARDYLNRPELTAERFVPHPFSSQPGARLYRTGDLCRYLPDGNILFLGRLDHQVKIRGNRIELGEIQAVLADHPAVREAVVTSLDDGAGGQELAAYFVAGATAPTVAELRGFLQRFLPDYMIPTHFVAIEAIPLSPNGKVDYKALPRPVHQRDHQCQYVPPRNSDEVLLVDIWREVLHIDQVGIHDNFFTLGGHSLLAIQVMSRMNRELNLSIPLRDLFEASTVETLAQRVLAARQSGVCADVPAILPVPRDRLLPASYGQEELWVIGRLLEGPSPYGFSSAARLRGPLDEQALEQSLNEVLRRHESLRTTFAEVDGQLVQVIAPHSPRPLTIVDLSGLPADRREDQVRRYAETQSQRPIDLSEGPLARVEVLRLAPDEHVVVASMHHIIYDGWSMEVLAHELSTAYLAFAAGLPSPLADLPIQYADFAVWQRDRLQGDVLEGLRRYWREQLNGLPTLELPIDRPRPQVRTTFGAHCERQLSSQLSHAVRQLRNAEGATTFMTLLAAFQLLLHRYSGQDDFAIGTPVAGRLRPETEGLIGYFINDLVLRADVSGDPSFRQLLGRARETVLQAFSHQELPFMHLVRELNPARSPNRHPLIQVELVLQNTPSASKDLPGIEWGEVGSETRAGAADLDLSMIAREDEQGIHLLLSYRTDLFDEATIRLMLEHMQALLEAVVADPDQRLSQLLSQALPQLPDRRSSRKSSPARASSAKAKTPYVAPRTDMERELAAIWEGILKVDRVGVHDDFFELGGYSLLAVQVMARACTLLNRELPFAVIFASPTVATLAERVEAARHCESSRAPEEGPVVAEVASDSFRPTTGNRQSLVPLRSGASTTPVFCIHGLGGHVAGFLSLASSLTEARPVYGLQGQGLEAGQQPHDRIEAMAASYLNEIRRVQPRGPYLLVGWSMGGLIAMEAAQQLAAIREHVALVAMLDTYLSIPNDANLDPDDQSVIRWIAPQLNLCARELKELPLDRQWERIAEQAELAQGDGVADIRRLAAVCKAHLAAAARYQPQPYLGRAVLLQADAGRVGLERCWKELCPRLSVERVPGNHYSMLRKPQVDEVVKRLSRYLADAVHVDALVTNR